MTFLCLCIMKYSVACDLLESLSLSKHQSASLALMTRRWLLTCTTTESRVSALADPVVVDLLKTAQLQFSCGYDTMPKPVITPIRSTKLNVFTDGSCTSNGKKGAIAGFGVHVTAADLSTVVHRCKFRLEATEPQTNQRAELRALAYAIYYLSESVSEAVIYTDSKYGMDVLNTWSAGWEAKGWKKADGKPVLHTDIIIPMYEVWKTIRSRVRLSHVPAHTGASDPISQGNAMADSLATEATAATVATAATKNTIDE